MRRPFIPRRPPPSLCGGGNRHQTAPPSGGSTVESPPPGVAAADNDHLPRSCLRGGGFVSRRPHAKWQHRRSPATVKWRVTREPWAGFPSGPIGPGPVPWPFFVPPWSRPLFRTQWILLGPPMRYPMRIRFSPFGEATCPLLGGYLRFAPGVSWGSALRALGVAWVQWGSHAPPPLGP